MSRPGAGRAGRERGGCRPPSLLACTNSVEIEMERENVETTAVRLLKLQSKIHGWFFVHPLSNVYLEADKTELTSGLEASPDYCEKTILAVRRGTPAVEFDRVWEKQGRCILPPI